jgi:hypothetical protein
MSSEPEPKIFLILIPKLAISVSKHHRKNFHMTFAALENNHYESVKKPEYAKLVEVSIN